MAMGIAWQGKGADRVSLPRPMLMGDNLFCLLVQNIEHAAGSASRWSNVPWWKSSHQRKRSSLPKQCRSAGHRKRVVSGGRLPLWVVAVSVEVCAVEGAEVCDDEERPQVVRWKRPRGAVTAQVSANVPVKRTRMA